MNEAIFSRRLILSLVTQRCGAHITAFILSNSVLFRGELCDAMLRLPDEQDFSPQETEPCQSTIN